MYRIITIILLAAASLAAKAQTAREVLDATAKRLTNSGVRATFTATQFNGTTPQSETSGTMLMKGRKFHISTDEMLAWYDGKKQWSMLTNSTEANLTEPTEEELAQTNPAALIGIYKRGYDAKLSTSTLRGKATYVVHLKATSTAAEFSEIYIDIERATYTPLCIRAKHDDDWLRLAIMSFATDQKTKASDFEFPEKQYPNVDIIDLR